jgi:UDP-N-acetylglucosamine:LPS N-acetylglucosamine transferase
MKVVFIIPTGEEAELIYPIYKELSQRGFEVSNIETGTLCCGANTKLPKSTLIELGMKCTSITDYNTKSMVEILKIEKPDVIVTGSDQEYIHRAFLYAAKGLGIPTMLVDVAFGSNIYRGHWLTVRRTFYRLAYHFINILNKYFYILRTVISLRWSIIKIIKMVVGDIREAFIIEDARGMYGCEAVVVAGSWEKEVLINRGVKSDTIFVTGNPRMTEILQECNKETENKLRNQLGIGLDEKVILLHTSAQIEHGRWNVSMRKEFVNKVIDSLIPLMSNKVRLVIRIHPVESLSEYQGIIKDRTENIVLYKGLSFIDSLGMSDIILFNAYSMMVLEATALNKLSIILNVFNEIENLPYGEMGLAKCVYKYEDIEPIVNAMLNDTKIKDEYLKVIRQFYRDNKEFMDGKATERISNLIEELI